MYYLHAHVKVMMTKKEPAPVCACPITAANANGDDAIPVIDPVYRPEASFVPHSEMYREHGHAKVPAAKALQAAGLPETTPEEKDELEAYKDKKVSVPERLTKGSIPLEKEAEKVKAGDFMPPELMAGLVQVGQKWNIEDGFQRANNDNDILDEVAEPLKINTA